MLVHQAMARSARIGSGALSEEPRARLHLPESFSEGTVKRGVAELMDSQLARGARPGLSRPRRGAAQAPRVELASSCRFVSGWIAVSAN